MKRPDRDELIRLRTEERMTKADMAMRFRVSLTTVSRWFASMEIPAPEPKRGYTESLERYVSDEGMTSLEHARIVLGPRVVERIGHGYYLDGKPASVTDILAAADSVINPSRN